MILFENKNIEFKQEYVPEIRKEGAIYTSRNPVSSLS